MFQPKTFQISLFLTWMLLFTAQTQTFNINVTVGDEATLPCKNGKDFHDNCNKTTWLFREQNKTVTFFEDGKIHNDAGEKSVRLSVTTNCSLVLKKVTVQDAGLYYCRQFNTSGKQVSDSVIQLSVTEKENTLPKLTKSTTTTKSAPTSSTLATALKDTTTGWSAWIISAAVVGTSLLIIVVMLISWRKTKKKKRQMDENMGLSLNPAETQSGPGSSQDTVGPEDAVTYATINTSSRAQVQGRNAQHDGVIYSSVRAQSSSAGASSDPSILYSTIQKTKK